MLTDYEKLALAWLCALALCMVLVPISLAPLLALLLVTCVGLILSLSIVRQALHQFLSRLGRR